MTLTEVSDGVVEVASGGWEERKGSYPASKSSSGGTNGDGKGGNFASYAYTALPSLPITDF